MKKIWVVDDDRSIRWVLEKALMRAQMPCRRRDGSGGVQSCRRSRSAPVYEKTNTIPPILKPMELLDERTWAIFASGSAVRGFAAAAGQEDLSQVRALCIGAQTKAQAEQYHMHTKTAKTATLDGLVALALDCDKEEV